MLLKSSDPPWFEDSNQVDAMLAAAPSEFVADHARSFLRDGYCVIDDSVSLQACDAAIQAFQEWCEANGELVREKAKDHNHLPRLINLHLRDNRLLDLFVNNRALPLQDFLFNGDTSIYTSLYYESGSRQPIHRDAPYFRTIPENYFFGMWVALEDANEKNGALEVITSGHRLPAINPLEISRQYYDNLRNVPPIDDNLWNAYQAKVVAQCHEQGLEKRLLKVKKGQTVIWHPLLPHGGSAIQDITANRHSIVYHVVPGRMRVYQGEVFFNPARKRFANNPIWKYRKYQNRRVLDLKVTRFG